MKSIYAIALLVLSVLALLPSASSVQCNFNDLFVYQGSQTCQPREFVFPTGTLLPFTSLSGCPAGFSEATDVDGRFLLGTTIANADANATGGSNSITPGGSISAINFSTINNVSLLGLGNAALTSPTSVTPTFTGNNVDTTPLYRKVVWCRRN